MTKEFVDHLLKHDWPGNIRELKNVIERSVILVDGPELTPETLPKELLHAASKPTAVLESNGNGNGNGDYAIDDMEDLKSVEKTAYT